MEIQERAKKYAEGKALESITEAIEKAYAKGFADGYQEGQNKKEPLIEDGVEYVDLGLPSGTKWSSGFIRNDNGLYKRYIYEEATMINIPTSEQFRELVAYCEWRNITDGSHLVSVKILGRNGNSITLQSEAYSLSVANLGDVPKFWVKSEGTFVPSTHRACCDCKGGYRSGTSFMGEKLPIMLVK